MSDKNTTTTTTVDTKAIAAVSDTLAKAVGTFMNAVASLAKAVRDAVEAYKALGMSDKDIAAEVKRVFAEVGTTKNLNACLKKAGIRQRGIRCDAGIDGLLLKFSNVKPGKPSEAKDEPVFKRLSASALRLADGDKAKAIANLRKAIAALESAE